MSIKSHIQSIRERDAAKPSAMEVILCYPGFHALSIFHPLAHWFYKKNLRLLARVWAGAGRFVTGIEIHPGATIGRNLFIDHGMGVVIGETATIGDDCTIYHGVTLGGRGGSKDGKRHPDIGSNVIIGTGAQVLGAVSVGDGALVGANSVVTENIPAGVSAMGVPAKILCKAGNDFCSYGIPEDAEILMQKKG